MDFGEVCSIISSSEYFDRDWYQSRYPDVRLAGVDPLTHYVECGAKEGRNPGPLFDSAWYEQKYAATSSNPGGALLDFLLRGRNLGRFASARDFLTRKTRSEGWQELLDRYASMSPNRPPTASYDDFLELRRPWYEYFLVRGGKAYRAGDVDEALTNFQRAIQISADSGEAYVLYQGVFRERHASSLVPFEQMYAGKRLLVAHVSCAGREDAASASVDSFLDSSGAVANLTIVGDGRAELFRFLPSQKLLIVPSGDAYEYLSSKVWKLYVFLGLSEIDCPVLKVDDDIHCKSMPSLLDNVANAVDKTFYGGGSVVSVGPFQGANYWHLNKCTDPQRNEEPDTLLFAAPYATGKYYCLGSATAIALSKLALAHERVFLNELYGYEDRAVGAVLSHYGLPPQTFDLIKSGSLLRISQMPETGSRRLDLDQFLPPKGSS
jgi:hypothetical protein